MEILTYIAASFLGIGWLVLIVLVSYSESKQNPGDKKPSNLVTKDPFHDSSDTGTPS